MSVRSWHAGFLERQELVISLPILKCNVHKILLFHVDSLFFALIVCGENTDLLHSLHHFAIMFVKVWKVKKAFKIQIFWKGGKPTFQVCCSAQLHRFHQIMWTTSLSWVEIFFFFYVKTVWKIRWVGEEDRGVRYAGKISYFTVRGTWTWCRIAWVVMPVVFLWRPWSICHTCSTHCASAGPCMLSFPCDTRGRMLRVNTSHHRAAQFTDLTTDCPSVLAGTHGWSTVW